MKERVCRRHYEFTGIKERASFHYNRTHRNKGLHYNRAHRNEEKSLSITLLYLEKSRKEFVFTTTILTGMKERVFLFTTTVLTRMKERVCLQHYCTNRNVGKSLSSILLYSGMKERACLLYSKNEGNIVALLLMKERVCVLHCHIGAKQLFKRMTFEQNFKLSTWLSFITYIFPHRATK